MLEALEALAREELVGAERVLVVHAPPFAHGALTEVPGMPLASDVGAPFDGALWLVESDLRTGLRALRERLKAGARIVTAVELKRSPWERVRDLLARSHAERPTFEELCEALILHGLEHPRVLHVDPAWAAVAAEVPPDLETLDEVFAQPA